eukprot:scaffold436_cov267-Pinguiococcus_pyrenoidosus.AAC.8
MGAMQGFDWAWRYPDAVKRVIAICGTSRCGDLNRVFLDSLEAALCSDPGYDAGSPHMQADSRNLSVASLGELLFSFSAS